MTSYLLDTNALSEVPKKNSDTGFMVWFTAIDELSLFTSCLVLGEIKKGISLIMDEAKQCDFNRWLDEIITGFDGRIVGLDQEIALTWGELVAAGQKLGRTPPAIDALIAAQCIYNEMTLVTRNTKDFEQFLGLKVLCPWSDK